MIKTFHHALLTDEVDTHALTITLKSAYAPAVDRAKTRASAADVGVAARAAHRPAKYNNVTGRTNRPNGKTLTLTPAKMTGT
ncbi:unannotated protein [freshwater metagenome]|uniref:Unannotated protein n=1 Tax=freshwater metagenome TaxID=449393 RepID=A0A6J6Y3J7_9ZZZZ